MIPCGKSRSRQWLKPFLEKFHGLPLGKRKRQDYIIRHDEKSTHKSSDFSKPRKSICKSNFAESRYFPAKITTDTGVTAQSKLNHRRAHRFLVQFAYATFLRTGFSTLRPPDTAALTSLLHHFFFVRAVISFMYFSLHAASMFASAARSGSVSPTSWRTQAPRRRSHADAAQSPCCQTPRTRRSPQRSRIPCGQRDCIGLVPANRQHTYCGEKQMFISPTPSVFLFKVWLRSF